MVEPSRRDVALRLFCPRHPFARGLARGPFLLALIFAVAAQAQPDRFASNQLIVKFEPATTAADVFALRASMGAKVARRFPSIGAELWNVAGIGVPDAVARLESSAGVVYAEPNYLVQVDDVFPDDPRFDTQWALHNIGQTGGTVDADIDAPEAWTFETGGDVLVGVIDTGVDWEHPDLAANIFINPGEIADNHLDDDQNGFIDDVHGWDFLNEDNDPDDDNGHGTHVAGIIAARGNNGVGIAGVSWSARILPLKFLSAIGTGSTADAIRAVEYATAMGARLTNNSWGGVAYSQAMRDAIEAAGEADILFVAASGNNGANIEAFAHYPASFDLPNIISVMSSDASDGRSVFSNFGAISVDLAAPGADIVSTFPGERYASASGTSMAAPHVSGAACVLWSAAPTMNHQEVRDAILNSVDKIPALQGVTVTGGRLNLNGVMSQLDDVPPAAIADLAVQSTGSTTAGLTWTASGDDGNVRRATRYDVRYATYPIDASNFDTATPANAVSAPQDPGSAESFEVSGLDYLTTYYFAIVVEDERANRSPVSNGASGTTLGAPALDYGPSSFMASLLTGGVAVQSLEIRNTAEGTLDFSTAGAPLPSWLRVDPPSGRVTAGSSTQVAVRIDATRLGGGDYAAGIELHTNDAAHSVATIPVSLHVTSAPDLAVTPPEIDFGIRFTGTCATDTVIVANIGAEPLQVSEVRLANPEFSTDPAGFILQPNEERVLAVQFCPSAEEIVPGIPRQYPRQSRARLILVSNDPDHAEYSVSIYGEAVDPPVIDVSPPALDASLVTGAVATRTLKISNSGASNLDFEISLEELGGASRVDVLGAGPSQTGGNVVAVGRPLSRAELASLPAAIATKVTGALDRHAPPRHSATRRELEVVDGEVFGSDQNEFLGGPRTRGNLFHCTTPTTLIEHRFYMGPSTATQLWFVVYEGDEQSGVYNLVSASNVSPAGPGLGWYSSGDVSVPMRAGKFYLIAAAFEEATLYYNAQNIAPYPIPASFGELTGAAGWTWQPFDQFPPAPLQFVTEAAFAEPVAYYQTIVTGSAVRWLSLDAEAGTIAPEASMDIAIRFDATGMAGGEYDARLRVSSNDPKTPEMVIPARATVTGAPDIAVTPTTLDFGTVFVGTSVQDTVVVANTGTEFLLVSGLSVDRAGYSADATSFVLGPGTRRPVIVTFAPASAGEYAATLSITSIDPDEGAVVVSLSGAALDPPIVAVTPPSFDVAIASGATITNAMTIRNSGATPLEFEIETSTTASRAAPRTHLPVARSSGDFPRGEHAASIGAAPIGRGAARPLNAPAAIPAVSAGFAFATETQYRQAARVRLDSPERIDLFGSAPTFIWAGDFGVGDNSFAYAVDELNHFVKIDTLTGAQVDLGTLKPVGAEVWSGMALDPTDGTMYAVTTDARQSWLYTVDVAAPSATLIGRIFSPAIVALAVDDDGVAYGLDVINDNLVAIDKSSGEGTEIGSLGYDANFGHGMAFDPVSEQLYVSAFNNFRFQSELRIADRSTGATTLVGLLGGIEPGGLVQLGWFAIPGLGGVPWMQAHPRRGAVAAGESADIAVHVDARHLIGGTYDASLLVVSNDPHAASVVVPVRARVSGEPELALSDSLLEFGDVFMGGSATRTLTVTNTGTDVLEITSVVASGDFSVDGSAVSLAPGASHYIVVTLAPTSLGERAGELILTSNDADEAARAVPLRGDGRAPPVMLVTPSAFDELLKTGQRVTRALTIDNTRGAAALVWNAASRYAGDARSVVATSPVFSGHASEDLYKETPRHPPDLTRPSAVFAFESPDAVSAGVDPPASTSLETILASLEVRHPQVTAVIPERWNFFDGTSGDGILDGGYDMFDGGNFLSTNLGGTIMYSDGVIVDSDHFGVGGRFFTRKYPGLFVLVAEMNGVDFFQVTGNLGADGSGFADGAVLHARAAGADFTGFVKRVYGAQEDDPSVNHMIIVQENAAATHEFSTDTNSDYHRAVNLGGGRRLYYLLYSGWQGAYIDDEASLNIMGAFLQALGLSPSWARVTPGAGVVPAGATSRVDVVFDAAGLQGIHQAHVVVAGNDPLTPESVVPARIDVAVAPDLQLSARVVRFAPLFVGAVAQQSLRVANAGTDTLHVSAVQSGLPDFFAERNAFALAPAETLTLAISFQPTTVGQRTSALSIMSDDPDESAAAVVTIGEGLPAPVLAVSPASLADTLATGESSSKRLTLTNAGGSALDVMLSISGARGATNTTIGGGPDYFGYRWEDSSEPGGPTMAWIDASAGTALALSNDGYAENIPLGFSFRYYGTSFTSVGISANGWLSFTATGAGFPADVPAADFVAGVIAPYALDLDPAGGTVRYLTTGLAPDRRFVLEYRDVAVGGSGELATFQVVFYERTHTIRFQYLHAPQPPQGFGIESMDETMGLGDGGSGITFANPARVGDGYAIEWIAPPAWLSVDWPSASIPEAGSFDVTVGFDAALLADASYHARIELRSNDPAAPRTVVPVTLTVQPRTTDGPGTHEIPQRFALHENRPNPFNPSTTIAYDLPRASRVSVTVYDVRGREVVTLVSGSKPAGEHRVAWDGRDAQRQPVASGVYFCRLAAEGFVQTKKMVLLK